MSQHVTPPCRDCAAQHPRLHPPHCTFCQELGLAEDLLCELNRSIQTPEQLVCEAFRPSRLRLLAGGRSRRCAAPNPSTPPLQAPPVGQQSDRMKYLWTLAQQTLRANPDAVLIQLRYHLVWSTACRRPVFRNDDTAFERIHQTFLAASKAIGGTAALMHLADDHLHLFVESDGTRSLDNIVKRLKQAAADGLQTTAKEHANPPEELWDTTYFATTVTALD